MGPFFFRLKQDLEAAGAEVLKIHFCAGDRLFYPSAALDYRGTLAAWPAFLQGFLAEHRIDTVMLFGDCRAYHRVVPALIRARGGKLYVFEEGYLRPDYITIDEGGANNFSNLPRDPGYYRRYRPQPIAKAERQTVSHAFWFAALYAIGYALANFLMRWRYRHYRHHRSLNPLAQAFYWLRSGARKLWFKQREQAFARRLTATDPGQRLPPFFLVPLQTHNDAQIQVHSQFDSVEAFIDTVLRSFAAQAPKETSLVLKHHPLDRGYRDYGRWLRERLPHYGLQGRVHYVHDVHLPTLLDQALGTVVINSTVGLSSILHGTPVCVLGEPIYHLPGLTHQGPLAAFWRQREPVDRDLFERFRAWLLAHNQANGNFYRALPVFANACGVGWPPLFGLERQPQPVPKPATLPAPEAAEPQPTVSLLLEPARSQAA